MGAYFLPSCSHLGPRLTPSPAACKVHRSPAGKSMGFASVTALASLRLRHSFRIRQALASGRCLRRVTFACCPIREEEMNIMQTLLRRSLMNSVR